MTNIYIVLPTSFNDKLSTYTFVNNGSWVHYLINRINVEWGVPSFFEKSIIKVWVVDDLPENHTFFSLDIRWLSCQGTGSKTEGTKQIILLSLPFIV